MKKIATCIIVVFAIFISLTGIYAVSSVAILDVENTESIYKFSENADIKLPFIRISNERMIIDKDVIKSGLSFARDSLNVEKSLKGIQVLTSSDTVRVTGDLEYGMIIAPTVIIEGKVEKSLIVMADNITISKDAVIKEDLLCSTSKLSMLGNIEGNLLGVVSSANIEGTIAQDFRVRTDSVILGENSNIQGNIYITSNNSIDIGDKYPNAVININENVDKPYTMDIWGIFTTSLLFGLIYLLISTKTNIFKNNLNKVKQYRVSTIIYGIASILLFPIIIIAFILLTIIGFGIITIPSLIIYIAFMLVSFILSLFVVGSLISEYVSNKYNDKIKGNWYKLVFSTCVFCILNILSNITLIGFTISIILCVLSAGILFTIIFRRGIEQKQSIN